MSSSSAPANAHPDTPLLPAFMHATTIWNLIKTPDGLAKNPHLCWLLLVSTFTEDIKRLGSPDNEKSWMDSHADHEELASAIIGDLAYCPASFPGDHNLTLKMRMLWAGKDLERLAKSLFGYQFIDKDDIEIMFEDSDLIRMEITRQELNYETMNKSDANAITTRAISILKRKMFAIAKKKSFMATYPFLAQEPEGVPLGSLVDDLKEDPKFAKMKGDRNALMKDSGKNADSIEKLEDAMNGLARELAKKKSPTVDSTADYPFLDQEPEGVPLASLMDALHDDPDFSKDAALHEAQSDQPTQDVKAIKRLEVAMNARTHKLAKKKCLTVAVSASLQKLSEYLAFQSSKFDAERMPNDIVKDIVREGVSKGIPIDDVARVFVSESSYLESLFNWNMGSERKHYDMDMQIMSMVRELRNVGTHSSFNVDPKDNSVSLEVTFNNGNSRDAFKFDTFTSLAAQCKKFYEDGVGMLGFEVNLNPLGEFVIVRRMCSFEAVPCFSQCQPLTAFCEKHQRCRICGDTLNPAGSSRVYCPRHNVCVDQSCKSTPAFKSGFCFGHKRFRPQKKNLVQKSSDQTQPNSKLLKVCEYAFCSELTPLQFCAQHQHECSWGPCKARLDSSHVYVDKPLCLLHTLEGLNSNERSHLEVLLGRPL